VNNLDRQQAFSGTKDVADALKIDAARLEAYLAAQVQGFAGPLTVKQFKGGQSNPTYLLQTPARSYVLRRKPPGKLLPSAHAVDREFRVISALYGQGFPVAEPILYCNDDSVAGTAFYVMSFVDGRVFWEPNMPASNPAERAAVYDAMNETIARLHSLVEAIPRLRNREDRGDGAADRLAAATYSAGRPGTAGAWRLPARQYDPSARRAEDRCRA
jgi:aminoglycoside phosphotransferase (APT) family kinase protein